MTLQKAIETADRYFILNHNVPRAELVEAAELLIEAGKAVLAYRPYDDSFFFDDLPGETRDDKDEVTSEDIKYREKWALDTKDGKEENDGR